MPLPLSVLNSVAEKLCFGGGIYCHIALYVTGFIALAMRLSEWQFKVLCHLSCNKSAFLSILVLLTDLNFWCLSPKYFMPLMTGCTSFQIQGFERVSY